MRFVALCLTVLVGCVSSGAVPCGDQICPADTSCRTVAGENYCATAEQISSCENVDEGEPCTTRLIMAGVCHEGLCFEARCGNSFVDPGEACDDGNLESGDGCARDCASQEVCGNGVTDPIRGEQCDDQNLMSGDGCDSKCLPEHPAWRSLDGERMSALTRVPTKDAAMAFDEAHGVTVMFGGIDDNDQLLDDTWLWNGRGWSRAAVTDRPSARSGATMAYDPKRKRVVLFGGDTATGVVSDTWEWDGTTWHYVPTTDQPHARANASMVYEPQQKRILLFGGSYGNTVWDYSANKTWAWDGTAWKGDLSIMPPTLLGPRPGTRTRAHMAYDAKRNKIVFYGGVGLHDDGSSTTIGTWPETWEYDATPQPGGWPDGSWKIASSTPPSDAGQVIVDQFVMAWEPNTQQIILMGGVDGNGDEHAASFVWNGTAWTALDPNMTQIGRNRHAAATDTVRKQVVTWGDEGATVQRETEEFDGTRWNVVNNGSGAASSVTAQIAVDTGRGRAVLFGEDGTTWEHDGYAWVPVTPPTGSPTPRVDVAMAYDSERREIVMFGGRSGSTNLDETWIYKGGAWEQRAVTGPTARRGAAMAFDAKRKQIVLFGGVDSASMPIEDTWTWDGSAWTKKSPATSAPGRGYAGMAYHADLELVVMFAGGYLLPSGSSGSDSNVFLWNGTTWAQAPIAGSTPHPSARLAPAMAWDPARRSIIAVGGTTISSYLQDTWEWDATSWDGSTLAGGWTLVSTNQPPPNRSGGALFAHPRGDGVLLYGGHTSSSPADDLRDTWQLHWIGNTPVEECRDKDADTDGDGLPTCADLDCWATCTPDCPPGTSCMTSGCGDGICNGYLETYRTCPQDCMTPPSVCGDYHCDPSESCAGDCL